ncbi:FecR family protein [Bordetella genomosp. 12]|nr:FecR family protein [Bordetella genomosp. 12]
MRPPNDTSTSDDPRDLAAAWFAHLQSGDATPADRRAFEQWRAAHPEHARQYRNVQQIWEGTLAIPEHELRAILSQRPAAVSRPNRVRRRLAWGLAGGLTFALTGAVALNGGWLQTPLQTLQIATRRGERRQVALPDGSVLDVNTGTRAVVRMYRDKRVVELLEGEIFFAVQRDAGRPFLVDAGASRVMVTGTRFNVRYDNDAMRVSVESGSVEVSSGPWWNRRTRALAKGQGVHTAPGQALSAVEPVDLQAMLAWQRGKIVFENTPLAQAVAEINRYLKRPARLEAPALGNHRIAGIFSVNDPQSLIDMLPEIAPVRVFHLPDGEISIVGR